jgi:hypothetical protein
LPWRNRKTPGADHARAAVTAFYGIDWKSISCFRRIDLVAVGVKNYLKSAQGGVNRAIAALADDNTKSAAAFAAAASANINSALKAYREKKKKSKDSLQKLTVAFKKIVDTIADFDAGKKDMISAYVSIDTAAKIVLAEQKWNQSS